MDEKIIDIGFVPLVQPKILVVDDEPSIQSLVIATLRMDYDVLSAFNGREGVLKAVNLKPSLILMDVNMPDIGGYEAIRLLQADVSTRDIPVIVMTVRNFDPATIQFIHSERNVVAYLNKPFRTNALRDLIKKHLKP